MDEKKSVQNRWNVERTKLSLNQQYAHLFTKGFDVFRPLYQTILREHYLLL